MTIKFKETRDIPMAGIVELYEANGWSAAAKPEKLRDGLVNSHSLVSAWDGDRLVGLGNAISGGHLVVYYPHLLGLPEYQNQGIGGDLLWRLMAIYDGYHQQVVLADGRAIDFYRKHGFERAGGTEPMWLYRGTEH